MRQFFHIAAALLITLRLHCQMPVGSWSDHLRYNSAYNIAAGLKEIYVSTGSSILIYNKEYSELKKLSKVNGLTETGISAIAWSEENETLIIGYRSAKIDLVRKSSVYCIPDIHDKFISGKETINRIRVTGKHAFIATSSGIVVADMVKREIHDTWKPGPGHEKNEVYDLAFGNGKIYAVTERGIWYADISAQGLAYFANWHLIDQMPAPYSCYDLALFSGNKLFVNKRGSDGEADRIYSIGEEVTLFSYIPGVRYRSFDISSNGFTVTSSGFVKLYRHDGSLQKTITSYGWGIPDISQAAAADGNLWLADINYGLILGENLTNFTNLSLPGPSSNDIFHISSVNGRAVFCAGGADKAWNGLGKAYRVSVFDNNIFYNILSGDAYDSMRSAVDPDDDSHFFVSSWGNGLYEYRNKILVKQYSASNSPLQAAGPGFNSVRVCGLAFDKLKNLWVAQSGAAVSIKILKPDGTWINYPLTIEAPVAGDIIAAKNGYKWIILASGNGLFVLDDNNTPGNFSDDRNRKVTIKDTDGRIINSVYSIAEDLDGNIWAGTDQGPVIFYNPDRIFDEDPAFYRIKVPRDDGSGLADYMLGSETITTIAVDGANRKWLGTVSSGAYLLSPDGYRMLKNHNKRNSPLYTDSVVSIAVDNKTGEVWFGTSEGVLSVRETATRGENAFANVYPFPNPVREDYTGNVTITGLIRDTRIKITDVSGNLVFETISEGGQATWDLSTYKGRRVTTGVYLIFCSEEGGTQSFVTKILVVR